MRPAVEDRGHVPGDAELEMLDPPGLQAPAGRQMVEGDPGRDAETAFAHLFDCLIPAVMPGRGQPSAVAWAAQRKGPGCYPGASRLFPPALR